ncbi:L,D-transpeptidase family protein [Egicoccus sp. AB-alg2]|uniref:L,D-transpeptidase family protein n=1 Tax=Egicoccus sp. AB-alg2 TaxID=3242693 RepID=UPI00359CC3FE
MSALTLPSFRDTRLVAGRGMRLLLTVLLAVSLLGIGGVGTAEAATSNATIKELQQRLKDLGYPVGTVDGVDGPRTRQGLCAWRRLSGGTASRNALAAGELKAIRATTGLPKAAAGRGVTIDKTCQTIYHRADGKWRKVLITSTGTGGLPRNGDFRIQRVKQGWHTSSLYPSPTPNMYSPMYFDGAIAIHGSNSVPAKPASHGCARVTPKGADYLFARLKVGDPVKVIGKY